MGIQLFFWSSCFLILFWVATAIVVLCRVGGTTSCTYIYRGSYTSACVLLNLLNKLGKRDKMRGLLSILSLFHNFNKFNNTGAGILDSICHKTLRLCWNLISCGKKSLCMQRYYELHFIHVTLPNKSVNHYLFINFNARRFTPRHHVMW